MQNNRTVTIKEISWKEISRIWTMELWSNRESPIEPHSAMTWPFEGDPPKYDMKAFDYPVTFFGAFVNGILIGVNSGHKTADHQYRSRGLWVDCVWRRNGISQLLFDNTEEQARKENCSFIWSLPRVGILSCYKLFGFETVGDSFKTETSDANVYVIKYLD